MYKMTTAALFRSSTLLSRQGYEYLLRLPLEAMSSECHTSPPHPHHFTTCVSQSLFIHDSFMLVFLLTFFFVHPFFSLIKIFAFGDFSLFSYFYTHNWQLRNLLATTVVSLVNMLKALFDGATNKQIT